MSRFHSHLNTAVKIIDSYKGEMPLAAYLKQFFAAEKKYGSTDRKQLTHLCYCYYRLGFAAANLSTERRIILAYFLCNNTASPFLEAIQPEWNELITGTLAEKTAHIQYEFSVSDIFPFADAVNVDAKSFSQSFLHQPGVHLRIRPGQQKKVLDKLKSLALNFIIEEDCICLSPGTNVAQLATTDCTVVIQDYNSQKVLDYLKTSAANFNHTSPQLWDCCAASGGKSILAFDILGGKIQLTVSDIRESILANLKHRFSRAGIKNYTAFTVNLLHPDAVPAATLFDIVICDAPCTGSGTWARTPEQLYFFKPAAIADFSKKQKAIAANAARAVKAGGLFFYITCSVFREENEAVVNWLATTQQLQILHMKLLEGWHKNADSMFVAVFGK
ncbi:MAG TPA: Fmu (Sun) domain-containing protein [Ferruginibacter sp.]|nr:Fmu (Sun) domain-containing protein [Ferruginibacter sp.]HMP21696.1 Fmu (Sun) domain-containing protein [Ferruginibacter sp.]